MKSHITHIQQNKHNLERVFTITVQHKIKIKPINTKPTRMRHGQEPSILDLVIINEEGMIEEIEYFSSLWESNPMMICFNFICYIQQTRIN